MFAIMKSKDAVTTCMKYKTQQNGLGEEKCLQYPSHLKPRYVSHNQTLIPVITVNPYQHSFVQSDPLFNVQEGHQNGIDVEKCCQQQFQSYYKEDFREDQIYQYNDDQPN